MYKECGTCITKQKYVLVLSNIKKIVKPIFIGSCQNEIENQKFFVRTYQFLNSMGCCIMGISSNYSVVFYMKMISGELSIFFLNLNVMLFK